MTPDDPVTLTWEDAQWLGQLKQWWKGYPKNTPQVFPQDFSTGGKESFQSIQLDSPGYRGITSSVTGHVVYLTSKTGTTWKRAQNGYSAGNGGGDLRTQTIRFDYGNGFYFANTAVLCRFYFGQWWVCTPGSATVKATLQGSLTGQSAVDVNVKDKSGTATGTIVSATPDFNVSTTVNSGNDVIITQRDDLWFILTIPCVTV